MSSRPNLVLVNETTWIDDVHDVFRSRGTAWSYAAHAMILPKSNGSGFVEVNLDVEVQKGRAILCLTDESLNVIFQQAMVSELDGPQKLKLFCNEEKSPLALVIRIAPECDLIQVSVRDCNIRLRPRVDLKFPDLSGKQLKPITRWLEYYISPSVAPVDDDDARYRELLFDELEREVDVNWIEGLRLRLTPRDPVARATWISGLYEPNAAYTLKEFVSKGSLFFDVGANIGIFTLLGSRWVGPRGIVVALEPSPREFAKLKANLAINNIQNVSALQIAAGKRADALSLKVAPPDRAGLNSLGAEIPYGVNEVNAFQVPIETLDKVISSYPNRKLSAIKIDVEGKDFEVLCGAARILKECRPAIVVETDLGGGNAIDIMRSSTLGILRDHGYQLQVISEITGRLEPLAERIHFGSQNILALPQELKKQSTFMRKHTKL